MRVAVIDIGSNSIKMLVAQRGADGSPLEIVSRATEARISRGISSERPHLEAKAMESAVGVVSEMVAEARALGVENLAAVATSAVRDASNGSEFRDKLRAATGLELRILSGLQEAALIGRGLSTDPALANLQDFDVFDLGGGSMECLALHGRTVEAAVSLPLGCVRLTERFVAEPGSPLSDAAASAIAEHVRTTLLASGFPFPVPRAARIIGTGGTLATVCAIVAGPGQPPQMEPSSIPVTLLRRILDRMAPLRLDDRKKVEGLSPARADVFPAALVTLLALAEVGRFEELQFSLRNLRWGVASEILAR
ncbi:MAG TPA: phosphatase [Opitutaceae bacterium]|jgi:exopolyphosphatase/guanosine-5'-triphosphate,3'-diphosphate pyrophosphatase